MANRHQKRWGPRLRTAGALMLLGGAVALLDHLLFPHTTDPVLGGSPRAMVALALLLLVVGAVLFGLGRRWRA